MLRLKVVVKVNFFNVDALAMFDAGASAFSNSGGYSGRTPNGKPDREKNYLFISSLLY